MSITVKLNKLLKNSLNLLTNDELQQLLANTTEYILTFIHFDHHLHDLLTKTYTDIQKIEIFDALAAEYRQAGKINATRLAQHIANYKSVDTEVFDEKENSIT